MIMSQTFAIIILGVIPYKYNRLLKTDKENAADVKDLEKKELFDQFAKLNSQSTERP